MTSSVLTFRTRFSNVEHFFPEARDCFKVLLELASGKPVEFEEIESKQVDIEIQSTLNEGGQPPLLNRVSRMVESNLRQSIDFSKPRNLTNKQPFGDAKVNIFYSAENHRPPPGAWDAYLTFDTLDFGGRNAYLPLWWLTSTDLLGKTDSPFLGKSLSVEELTTGRFADLEKRKNFCVAFSGKAWPFRVHGINLLSQIGKIDVFGDLARRPVENKFDIASKYKFILCFENDLYPGYVTEKLPEAWATGAIPLYWGDDRAGSFNKRSHLNLNDFSSFDLFLSAVEELHTHDSKWLQMASQPLLDRAPSLEKVVHVLRDALKRKRLI